MPTEEKNMVCRDQENHPSKSGSKDLKAEIGTLETPFEHIALAFSGGGFRAASFALGTLSFLNEVPFKKGQPGTLLQNVTYMSSASGGTITTSTYALHSAQGKSFAEFYTHLFRNFTGMDLMTEALELLNDPRVWKAHPDKTRNIINAFALAYDKLLYHHETVEALKSGPDKTHLDEVCFNATELYRGLLFRQAVQMRPDPIALQQKNDEYLYGNFIVHLEHAAAARLRIADLLAASSCFPAGFEPIVFPKDFASPNATKRFLLDNLEVEPQRLSHSELEWLYAKDDIRRTYDDLPKPFTPKEFQESLEKLPLNDGFNVCLMDGGITDNQGLESIILANRRRNEGKSGFQPFDLMMICDVSSHYMDAYQLPPAPKTPGMFNIARLLTVLFILLGVSIAGAILPWTYFGAKACSVATIGVAAVISLLSLVAIVRNMFRLQAIFVLAACIAGIFLTLNGSIGEIACRNVLTVVAALAGIFAMIGIATIYRIRTFISGQVSGESGLDLSKNFSENIVGMLFRYFKKLPFNVLQFMVTERVTSVLTLNNDVFLKRIRYLLYDQFFNQHNVKATGRLKANHIYDLTFTNDANRCKSYTHSIEPSLTMQIVAETAFGMSTTLWFAKEDQKRHSMAAIIATGQFTTCYNLLDYIAKLKKHYPNEPGSVFSRLSPERQAQVNEIEAGLNVQWEEFQKDPFWLYNRSGRNIPGFQPVKADRETFPFPENFDHLR